MEKMSIIPVYSENEQKKVNKRNIEKEENHEREVELTAEFILNTIKKDGIYVETYQLDEKNQIDRNTVITDNAGRTMLEMVKTVDISTEGLGGLVTSIMKKDENIKLTTKVEDGKLMLKFENKFRVGTLVNWVNQDAVQWHEPKRISWISDDGQYVFVEGGNTGILVTQLEEAA